MNNTDCFIAERIVLASSAGGPGFNPDRGPYHTKDVKKWYQWFLVYHSTLKGKTLSISEIANSNYTIFEDLMEDWLNFQILSLLKTNTQTKHVTSIISLYFDTDKGIYVSSWEFFWQLIATWLRIPRTKYISLCNRHCVQIAPTCSRYTSSMV